MPAPTNFNNLATDLKAVQHKLATSTYNAVFAYASETRASAAVEASALDKQLRVMLDNANTDACQLVDIMHSSANTPLAAASELIRRLEALATVQDAPQAMGSTDRPKICLGSACPGGSACCGRSVGGVLGGQQGTR